MKKILVATLALAAVSMTSFAQEGFGWGIKAGINGASLTNTKDLIGAKNKMRVGFTAGVFVDYKFCNWFGASADVLYSSQGNKFDVTLPTGTFTTAQRLNYLDIPLLAKFYVVNGLHIDLGPQFGFLMSAKSHAKEGGNKVSEKIEGLKTFDFSVPVGLGYEFPMGLKLDFRYNIGLTKIEKKVDDYQSKMKNSVFSFTVGWRF